MQRRHLKASSSFKVKSICAPAYPRGVVVLIQASAVVALDDEVESLAET
jgi:hypothetical protein